MITLFKDQLVPKSDYLVLDSGDYKNEELVICYLNSDSTITVSYQAYYIANGINFGE